MMRRGCISLGNITCGDCQKVIPYPERYLIIDDKKGNTTRLCADCALKKGYASHKSERGETTFTFFIEKEI